MAEPLLPLLNTFLQFDLVLPVMIVADIASDVEHPCLEITLSAKQVSIFQDSEESVLHQILAQFLIFVHAIKETIQRPFIAFKEQAEPVQVAVPHFLHQSIVRKRFQNPYFEGVNPRFIESLQVNLIYFAVDAGHGFVGRLNDLNEMKNYIVLLFTTMSVFTYGQTFNQLVWSDEFNKPGVPDPNKWGYDLGDGCPNVCGWGNNELEYYTNDPKNVRVENGSLIIEAHKEAKGGKPYTSTRIVSKNHGDWLYGRIEVRAKLPEGLGTWPAIWMLSTDWTYGGWPASGEIDIMEHVGFDPTIVHGTIHTEAYNHLKGTQKEGKMPVPTCMTEMHVYGINWTKDKMEFFIDDKVYHTVVRDSKDDFRGWPFDQRFHLIMNLAVGGNWGGMKGVDEKIWPRKMEIDYVRVYQ